MSESSFKSKILRQYRRDGWLVVGLIQTTLNGIPDTMLLKRGEQPIFIEFKAKGKTARPLQAYRHKEIEQKTGIKTIVMVEP